jgi:hypothetical protein
MKMYAKFIIFFSVFLIGCTDIHDASSDPSTNFNDELTKVFNSEKNLPVILLNEKSTVSALERSVQVFNNGNVIFKDSTLAGDKIYHVSQDKLKILLLTIEKGGFFRINWNSFEEVLLKKPLLNDGAITSLQIKIGRYESQVSAYGLSVLAKQLNEHKQIQELGRAVELIKELIPESDW